MSKKTKDLVRELRRAIGLTQSDFATMIGASKDTVVSWEAGRNRLSAEFARRIEFATGAVAGMLLAKKGRLMGRGFAGRLVPYDRGIYEEHSRTRTGRSDEVNARGHARNCCDALEVLFLAASRPLRGRANRLPGVVQSFIQWCEGARKEFKLEKEIDLILGMRKKKLRIAHSWREWRRMQKEDPTAARVMGFKDDPSKADGESLTLETEIVPVWTPGYRMGGAG